MNARNPMPEPRTIALFCILACAAAAAGEALDGAVRDFEAGKVDEARRAAESIPSEDADYAKAQYLVGEIALSQDDGTAAEVAFRSASEAKPDSAPVLTGLGRALLAIDRAEEAVAPLEKAVKIEPSSARALAWLGIAKLRSSDGKKGEAELKKALQAGADDPEVVRAVVLERIRSEDLEAAQKAANGFAAKSPKHAMGPFLKALVLEQRKKYDEAIEEYKRAATLDDTFLDAHKNLAILCIAQNPLYENAERTGIAMKHFGRYFALGGRDEKVKEIFETLKQFIREK